MESNHENQSKKIQAKLKFPKESSGEDHHQEEDEKTCNPNQEATAEAAHFCSVCNKSFSSGKALGGHMSAHVQANKGFNLMKKLKPNQTSKLNKPSKAAGIINHGDDYSNRRSGHGSVRGFIRRITCTVCGKKFPSSKSFYGHMRFHPERAWRGTSPPPAQRLPAVFVAAETKNNPSLLSGIEPDDQHQADNEEREDVEEEDDDQIYSSAEAAAMVHPEVDLTLSLEGLPVKARRRLNPTKSVASDDHQELIELCDQLMNLGKDFPGKKSCSRDKRDYVYAVQAVNSNTDFGFKLLSVEASSDSVINKYEKVSDESRSDKGKRKALENAETWKSMDLSKEYNHGDSSDHAGADSNDTMGDDAKVKSKKRKEKMKKTIDAEATPRKYTCTVCGNHFTSYQALGGHKSSHNKFKIKIENAINDYDDHQAPEGIKEGTDEQQAAAEGIIISPYHHKCKICKKNFPTGQALGGHMRSHWIASTETATASNQDNSPKESNQTRQKAISNQTRQKAMEFDLNKPPQDLED